MIQWSAGAYFHPEVAEESAQLLTDSNFWGHVDFEQFSLFAGLPPSEFPTYAENLSAMSYSSVNVGQEVVIFKHGSIALYSIRDFWKGKVGFQQFPCVATVGTTAVMTASGEVFSDWNERSADNANYHLPQVTQQRNVALLMYRPEEIDDFLGYTEKDVALYWRENEFDETLTEGLWKMGRQAQNYVGVRRSCTDEIDSVPACDISRGQTWVMVVGDSTMHGSFQNFQDIISQSQFEEQWYYDPISQQSVYYASIDVDSIFLEYTWGVDSGLVSMENSKFGQEKSDFIIYPNPSNGVITIDVSGLDINGLELNVMKITGKRILSLSEKILDKNQFLIQTNTWPEGIYLISIITRENRITQKFVKSARR